MAALDKAILAVVLLATVSSDDLEQRLLALEVKYYLVEDFISHKKNTAHISLQLSHAGAAVRGERRAAERRARAAREEPGARGAGGAAAAQPGRRRRLGAAETDRR